MRENNPSSRPDRDSQDGGRNPRIPYAPQQRAGPLLQAVGSDSSSAAVYLTFLRDLNLQGSLLRRGLFFSSVPPPPTFDPAKSSLLIRP